MLQVTYFDLINLDSNQCHLFCGYLDSISTNGLLKASIPWRKAANTNALISDHATLIRELSEIKNQQNQLKNIEWGNFTCNLIIVMFIVMIGFMLFKIFISKNLKFSKHFENIEV